VYCSACWWGDKWDPLSLGKTFDPKRPFLEQFAELQRQVPRLALFGKNNENCEYINHSENAKNCYLCVDVVAQDTYYSKWMINCRDCCDCYQLEKSDLCYESQYSVGMNNDIYAFLSDQSCNLLFCYDCEGCNDCLLCTHLRHKRFCIMNEQFTEEEYRKRLTEIDRGSYKTFSVLLERYHDLWRTTFHRQHQALVNATQCSGDLFYNCQNVRHSFGVIESRDCAYCYDAGHMQDCQDAYEPAFNCELQYDCHACNRGKRIAACSVCYDVVGCAYCDMCHNASHLFGCISLKHKEYCILNKQYTKEEYLALLPAVIGRMQSDGTWGEFFPASLLPFAYNETVAQEYYPLDRASAEERGWRWKEEEHAPPNSKKVISAAQLPDHIKDTPDDVLNWAIRCEATGKLFRIVKQELLYYRKMGLPLPRLHPDERYRQRMAFTNSRKLFERTCAKCSKTMETTYAPDRPEIVYCEDCYLKEVY